jgi:hypothetical protein
MMWMLLVWREHMMLMQSELGLFSLLNAIDGVPFLRRLGAHHDDGLYRASQQSAYSASLY